MVHAEDLGGVAELGELHGVAALHEGEDGVDVGAHLAVLLLQLVGLVLQLLGALDQHVRVLEPGGQAQSISTAAQQQQSTVEVYMYTIKNMCTCTHSVPLRAIYMYM